MKTRPSRSRTADEPPPGAARARISVRHAPIRNRQLVQLPAHALGARRQGDRRFAAEDARVRAQLGVGTKLAKILVTFGDWIEDRTTVIIVREPVGV